MTETAVAAFLQFATETEFNEVGKAFAEMVYFHASQHIIDKGMLQENAGLSLGDSALSHIKKRGFIELSDARPVVTLHVVGIDFEHRLRIGMGLRGGADIGVHLLRGRLLGSRAHKHFSRIGADAFSVEHIFIKEVGRTARRLMVNEDIIIYALLAVCHHGSVGNDRRAFTH